MLRILYLIGYERANQNIWNLLLDRYNMSEFHAQTASKFSIDDCQYNSIGKLKAQKRY